MLQSPCYLDGHKITLVKYPPIIGTLDTKSDRGNTQTSAQPALSFDDRTKLIFDFNPLIRVRLKRPSVR